MGHLQKLIFEIFFLNLVTQIFPGLCSLLIIYFVLLVDGLYAVYEASTLELWSFMMTSAMEGHSGETGRLFAISVFYMVLILFIVILLQVRLLLLIFIQCGLFL